MSKENTELIKENTESTDEDKYEDYDDYKLHGFALFRHRIALRLESFGELLFETQSSKESILYLLLMSVIGMVALYFVNGYSQIQMAFARPDKFVSVTIILEYTKKTDKI